MSDDYWVPDFERVELGGPAGDPYLTNQRIKVVWHTWEGTNWSAAESSFAPYPPHIGAKIFDRVREYVPLNKHAYALAGSHSEAEFVIQIELAGFAHDSRNMRDDEKQWIGEKVLAPILAYHDVPDVHPPFYDDMDGITLAVKESPIRFNQTDWDAYSGHVGHQHAPSPDAHWDPGRLDVDTIIRYARLKGMKQWRNTMGIAAAPTSMNLLQGGIAPNGQFWFRHWVVTADNGPGKPKGAWQPNWCEVPGHGLFKDSASPAEMINGDLHFAAKGMDDAMWRQIWVAAENKWSGWFSDGGTFR